MNCFALFYMYPYWRIWILALVFLRFLVQWLVCKPQKALVWGVSPSISIDSSYMYVCLKK